MQFTYYRTNPKISFCITYICLLRACPYKICETINRKSYQVFLKTLAKVGFIANVGKDWPGQVIQYGVHCPVRIPDWATILRPDPIAQVGFPFRFSPPNPIGTLQPAESRSNLTIEPQNHLAQLDNSPPRASFVQ